MYRAVLDTCALVPSVFEGLGLADAGIVVSVGTVLTTEDVRPLDDEA